jgi:hypothetical protein
MRVIFLDHDGVICLSNNWGSRFKKQKKVYTENNRPSFREIPVDLRFDDFDRKAIKVLNSIIEETDAEIVISSDWRDFATLEEIGQFYENQGICKKPISTTPNLREFDSDCFSLFSWKGWMERIRCLEIREWLNRNSVDRWIAVDDLNMSNEYLKPGLDFFVLTSKSNEGIKQCGISNKIISSLNESNG